MTNILGIKYEGRDAATGLLVDGELVPTCAQEYYTHDKHGYSSSKEVTIDCLLMRNKKYYK